MCPVPHFSTCRENIKNKFDTLVLVSLKKNVNTRNTYNTYTYVKIMNKTYRKTVYQQLNSHCLEA